MNNILNPFLFLLFLISINCYSQQLKLKIVANDSLQSSFYKKITYKKSNLSKENVLSEINNINLQLKKNGFLNSGISSLIKSDTLYTVSFSLGKKFQTIHIKFKKTKTILDFFHNSNYTIHKNSVQLDFNKISFFLNDLVQYYEANGYSFTTIKLINIDLLNNIASAELIIKDSKTRFIDKIVVKGYSKFPLSFLKNYVSKKSTFNTKKLDLISRSIKNLSFVSEIRKPEVLFTKDSTLIYIYLKKKKANQFDGLIGFSSKESGKGLNFEGYLNLQLVNIFNTGEKMSLLWKNNGSNNKTLNLQIETPYLFNSRFSPKLSFNIYNRDSTFININSKLFLMYDFNSKNKISTSIENEKSTFLLKNPSISNQDFTSIFYGLHYEHKSFSDHLLFPNRFYINLSSLFGTRKKDKASSSQQKIQFTSYYTIPINPKNSIFIKNNSSILISDSYLINELFKIGGSNNLRGFQEDSILSSSYSIFNLEYRWQTNKSSYLYSITDYAYNTNKSTALTSNLFGIGIGYAFTSKVGLINLSYTLGKKDQFPFRFKNAILNFSLVSFF